MQSPESSSRSTAHFSLPSQVVLLIHLFGIFFNFNTTHPNTLNPYILCLHYNNVDRWYMRMSLKGKITQTCLDVNYNFKHKTRLLKTTLSISIKKPYGIADCLTRGIIEDISGHLHIYITIFSLCQRLSESHRTRQ